MQKSPSLPFDAGSVPLNLIYCGLCPAQKEPAPGSRTDPDVCCSGAGCPCWMIVSLAWTGWSLLGKMRDGHSKIYENMRVLNGWNHDNQDKLHKLNHGFRVAYFQSHMAVQNSARSLSLSLSPSPVEPKLKASQASQASQGPKINHPIHNLGLLNSNGH